MSDEQDRAAAQLAALGPQADFYLLLAALERVLHPAVRIGDAGPAADEAIRLRSAPHLVFSAGDVASVKQEWAEDDQGRQRARYAVTTTFLGLSGSASPMPAYFTEEVALEDQERPVRRRFLDIFHHRLLSLLYRAVVKHDYPLEYTSDADDLWSRRLLALLGVGEARGHLSRSMLLRLAPLLSAGTRTARAVELALAEVLAGTVAPEQIRVEPFVGAWTPISDDQRMRLGTANCRLGRDAVLGGRAFDRTAKFRVHLGPVPMGVYRRLQSDGDLLPLVEETASLASPDHLDFGVEVHLAEEGLPQYRISRLHGSHLGRDAWLGRTEGTRQVGVR